MDTDVMRGESQRFATEELNAKLHTIYFGLLVQNMIKKSEIVSLERRLSVICMKQQEYYEIYKDKEREMNKLKLKIIRRDRISYKRSYLNKIFFPNHRRNLLKQNFNKWNGYVKWKHDIQDSYELRYEINVYENHILEYLHDLEAKNDLNKKKEDNIVTQFQVVSETKFKCKNCMKSFMQISNHSKACLYHPGDYILSCPKNCKGYGPECAVHLVERWSCCEKTGINDEGCIERWHVPRNEED